MRFIIGVLPDGITVIDPFAGSGTTLVAAMEKGLEWRAIDIDEEYCRIILDRTLGVNKC